MRRTLRGRSAVIVYNGEVYNSRELKQALQERGLVPTTRCDTELVLLAYMAFGDKCVEQIDGQFAFAIWDEERRRLFLARDPAGIKPLFYAQIGKTTVFASEPKALFEFPGIARAPHLPAIVEYMLHGHAFASGYVTGGRTFYSGVSAIPPGHTMIVDENGPACTPYWAAPAEDATPRDPAEWQDEVRAVLDKRIADYVSDEVPVGVALSGGVDSSIIAALASEEMTRRGRDIVACTISYAGGQVNDDLIHATAVVDLLKARGLNLRFYQSVLTVDDYLSELDDMLWHFDEPHWEVKQLAMYRNYGKLKESGAKVVLTGEGADELFFGYYRKFPGFTNPRLASSAELKQHWSSRVPYVTSLFSDDIRPEVEVIIRDLMEEALDRYYDSAWRAATPEKRMQHWYFKTFLPWLLTVNDRCSMAFSLEGRFPFLDKQIIELAFRMPASINTAGVGKAVLRQSFADILPREVVDRVQAPLPSPIDPRFHKVVGDAFGRALDDDDAGCWAMLSKSAAADLSRRYQSALSAIPHGEDAEPLVSYLYLNQPLELRTPQVFAHLSLLRWWRMNFSKR